MADLREQGYPIITNLSTGGYYLPSTKEEVEEHETQVRARALKMLGSLKVMKEWKKINLYERNLLNEMTIEKQEAFKNLKKVQNALDKFDNDKPDDVFLIDLRMEGLTQQQEDELYDIVHDKIVEYLESNEKAYKEIWYGK